MFPLPAHCPSLTHGWIPLSLCSVLHWPPALLQLPTQSTQPGAEFQFCVPLTNHSPWTSHSECEITFTNKVVWIFRRTWVKERIIRSGTSKSEVSILPSVLLYFSLLQFKRVLFASIISKKWQQKHVRPERFRTNRLSDFSLTLDTPPPPPCHKHLLQRHGTQKNTSHLGTRTLLKMYSEVLRWSHGVG